MNINSPIVCKFGGTSVSSRQSVLNLCQIVKNELNRHPVVVVSAMSGVTDLLLSLPNLPKSKIKSNLSHLEKIHKSLAIGVISQEVLLKKVNKFIDEKISEISKLLSDKKMLDKAFYDNLVSFGEIMSSYLITCVLLERGLKAQQVISTNLIVTDDNFGSAEFLLEPTRRKINEKLSPIILSKEIPVVTGFIGSTRDGEVTTLGRGGSDYSASIIGFCLGAKEIQIWTDVDGILTADPKLCKNARPLQTISFKEASELATFGAKVLHPRTIKPAISANIPVRVLNTFNPKNQGTLITGGIQSSSSIRAISCKKNITAVNIYSAEMFLQEGFLLKIFKVFAQNHISVDLVSVSEVSVSLTLDNEENLEEVVKQISEFAMVTVRHDLGIVSLIGEGIVRSSANLRKIFTVLDKENIITRMISLGTTNVNISLVIKADFVKAAVISLHDRMLLKE